jgi:ABC-type transport system involved in Fe-S cluster assembly fused permease/ATPase subunit
VLTESGIEEEGGHESLLAKGGFYGSLYRLYGDPAGGVSVGD